MGHYLSEMNGSPDPWKKEIITDPSYLRAGKIVYKEKGYWNKGCRVLRVERWRQIYDSRVYYEIHCQTGKSNHFISCSAQEISKHLPKIVRS